jgi:hypothetical protein
MSQFEFRFRRETRHGFKLTEWRRCAKNSHSGGSGSVVRSRSGHRIPRHAVEGLIDKSVDPYPVGDCTALYLC